MKVKVSSGISENGIVVGNAYDKYNSKNPVVKWMIGGFDKALSNFVSKVSPTTIHEVGCGEGYWVLKWVQQGITDQPGVLLPLTVLINPAQVI